MAVERGVLRAVGDTIDAAVKGGDKVAPKLGRKPIGADIEEPEFPLLPPGCPVKPLGKLGQVCYFLDEQGQLIGLDPQKVGKNHIRNLFGRRSQLCDEYWPRLDDQGKPKGHGQWMPERAGDLLMRACAWEGIFDPQGRVRGRGAHRGRSGELILHCGDTVYVAAPDAPGYVEPGLIGGFVYPTAPAIPRPDPGEPTSASAEELLVLLRTWKWARPLEDPMFLLGLIGAMMVGGALKWRPHAWVTGSKSTGKSTLHHLLEVLFDGAALHTHDASEASLRQILKQQTLPVFFDELESEEDNRRNAQVIKLARLASSGAVVFRGGQDHVGHEFTVRSSFLFSSILLPPMLSQDRSRLAILELHDLDEDAEEPELSERKLRAWGREFRKRLVDQWHRFEKTLFAYRKALAKYGHGGRAQDQFGTLLACADLLLYDYEPDVRLLEEWGERLAVDKLAEKAHDVADEDEAVQFLRTTQLQGRGGDEPWPVSKLIEVALTPEGSNQRDRLEYFGMAIGVPAEGKDGKVGFHKLKAEHSRDQVYLAIANAHEGLAKIFQKSRWPSGVWQQAFGRVTVRDAEGHVTQRAHRRVKVRYAGAAGTWSTLVPLAAIVDTTPDE